MTERNRFKISERSLSRDEIDSLANLTGTADFKSKLWDWQFLSSAKQYRHLVADNDCGLVGFNGVMARTAMVAGMPCAFIWSCDFIVQPELRGKGLGKYIKRELLVRHPQTIVASLGISVVASQLLAKMGWSNQPGLVEYRKIMSCHNLKDVGRFIVQKINQVKCLFLCWKNTGTAHSVEIKNSLPAPDMTDALWNKVAVQYEAIIVRNYEYLNWRYQCHPLASQYYQYLCVRNNTDDLLAIMVVRQQQHVVEIVDYVGPAESVSLKILLLKKVEVCFSQYRRISISVAMSDSDWACAAMACGFYKTNSILRFSVKMPESKNKKHRWFLMKGDADGELLGAARFAAGECNNG